MGVHPSGNGTEWTLVEAVDVDQPHGKDYLYSQHIAKGVRKRMNQEHSAFGDTTAGGIHKPGGSAVLGMEITDAVADPTDEIVADGTYRGHGLAWSYVVQAGANKGVLWCSTATAGATVSGDWTVVKMHPDLQWGGGDVTWAGAHEFDASVDFTGPCAFDNSVIVGADATLEILGDLSVAGCALFDGSVVITADSTLNVLGDLLAEGTCDFHDEADFSDIAVSGSFCTGTIVADVSGTATLQGGIIIKWGQIAVVSDVTTYDFDTAFPNNCYQAVACGGKNSVGSNDTSIYGISASGFGIASPAIQTPAHWFAIGN